MPSDPSPVPPPPRSSDSLPANRLKAGINAKQHGLQPGSALKQLQKGLQMKTKRLFERSGNEESDSRVALGIGAKSISFLFNLHRPALQVHAMCLRVGRVERSQSIWVHCCRPCCGRQTFGLHNHSACRQRLRSEPGVFAFTLKFQSAIETKSYVLLSSLPGFSKFECPKYEASHVLPYSVCSLASAGKYSKSQSNEMIEGVKSTVPWQSVQIGESLKSADRYCSNTKMST